jgi:alcohol oxidase
MSSTDNDSTIYDIIFAGGGAVACITAGRLAEADPSLKILIVEAGPHTRDEPNHIQPGRFYGCLFRPETFTLHQAKPSPALCDRAVVVPSGRALGGGSSVNFLVYTRAAASDYDDWENVYGNKGWGSDHLIPLLRKAETYQADSTNSTHGKSGSIKVSFAENPLNVSKSFLSAAEKFDKDRGGSDDTNAFFSCDGYGPWARYIDLKTGRRSDTAHHHIYNQDHNKNLKVLVRHRVVRVIFEGTRAVGIEYVDDTIGRGKGASEPLVARASRLVVVSAGAFGSPSILERSGVGSKDVLTRNNVQQVVDLPGVGEHYMDHNLIGLPFVASEDAETMDEVFRGNEEQLKRTYAVVLIVRSHARS